MNARLLKILVVEDHDDTRVILGRLLARLGHCCDLTSDVASALGRAACGGFDVLLTDIGLPDKSGWELLRELGALGHLPPRVISMSAFDGTIHAAWSKAAGCHHHLVKPFGMGALKEVLSHAV